MAPDIGGPPSSSASAGAAAAAGSAGVPKVQRVSYSLMPPDPTSYSYQEQEDKRVGGGGTATSVFRLPSIVENRTDKLSRTGPLLLPKQAHTHAQGQAELPHGGNRSSATAAPSTTSVPGHPMHTLAVTSLALDLTTCIDLADEPSQSDDDSDEEEEEEEEEAARKGKGGRRPRGILYTAARDGLTASWDLHLRMKPTPTPTPTPRRTGTRSLSSSADPAGEEAEAEVLGSIAESEGLPQRKSWEVEQPFWRAHVQTRRGVLGSQSPSYVHQHSNGSSSSGRNRDGRRAAAGGRANGGGGRAPREIGFRQCIQAHTDWINDLLLCNHNQTREWRSSLSFSCL